MNPVVQIKDGQVWIEGEDKPRGLCWCGCGEPTVIAARTDRKWTAYKGVARRYIAGHHGNARERWSGVRGWGDGLCECGCGGRTNIIAKTQNIVGHVKGKHFRYLTNHSRKAQGASLDSYIVDDNGCWIWQGHIDKGGYGRFGRFGGAYRATYQAHVGPIPAGMEIDHLCRVTACVNPDHLEAVTPEENQRRMREARGIGEYSEACGKGHRWADGHEYIDPSGKRHCRRCNTERSAGRKASTA